MFLRAKQQQEQISPNHVQAIFSGSVVTLSLFQQARELILVAIFTNTTCNKQRIELIRALRSTVRINISPLPFSCQIHKKRRIVGRVRCKNIKSECPAPTCDHPELLPGRCCKVCPGQTDSKLPRKENGKLQRMRPSAYERETN